MTATLDDVTNDTGRRGNRKKPAENTAEADAAREQGLSLTGPHGLLKQLTKTVIETALNEEIT
jgi:putative transposase